MHLSNVTFKRLLKWICRHCQKKLENAGETLSKQGCETGALCLCEPRIQEINTLKFASQVIF